MVGRSILLIVSLLLLISCGTASRATSFSPSSTPRPAPGRTLTQADNGQTMHLTVGEQLSLALQAPPGFQPWQVTPPDPRVLAPVVNPAETAARGVTLRAFRAVGAGQTAITASSRIECPSGQVCPALIQGFRVTVIVQ